MALETSNKNKKLTLEEYAKIKSRLTKAKLKLSFPLTAKILFILPLAYSLFLIIYYLLDVRHLAEH